MCRDFCPIDVLGLFGVVEEFSKQNLAFRLRPSSVWSLLSPPRTHSLEVHRWDRVGSRGEARDNNRER